MRNIHEVRKGCAIKKTLAVTALVLAGFSLLLIVVGLFVSAMTAAGGHRVLAAPTFLTTLVVAGLIALAAVVDFLLKRREKRRGGDGQKSSGSSRSRIRRVRLFAVLIVVSSGFQWIFAGIQTGKWGFPLSDLFIGISVAIGAAVATVLQRKPRSGRKGPSI